MLLIVVQEICVHLVCRKILVDLFVHFLFAGLLCSSVIVTRRGLGVIRFGSFEALRFEGTANHAQQFVFFFKIGTAVCTGEFPRGFFR